MPVEQRTHQTRFDVIRKLLTAFKHLDPIPDIDIDQFRVDIYIPALRVVIDCAEDGFCDRLEDEKRRVFLGRVLGCRFVEFDSHRSDFCIYELINKILNPDAK